MGVYFQCSGCGRIFWPSGDPVCFNCGGIAGSGEGNVFGSFLVQLVLGCVALFVLIRVLLPVFLLIIFVLSMVPMAFGILAAYMVAVVTAERMPAVAVEALPFLLFLFVWFILRILLFLRGRGRAGLIAVGIYFSIALFVAVVLVYAGISMYGVDALSAGAEVPVVVEGFAWVLEYVSFGKLPWLVDAYESYAAYVVGFDPKLLAVSLVVYLFIMPVEIVLANIAWRKRGRRFRRGAAPDVDSPESPA